MLLRREQCRLWWWSEMMLGLVCVPARGMFGEHSRVKALSRCFGQHSSVFQCGAPLLLGALAGSLLASVLPCSRARGDLAYNLAFEVPSFLGSLLGIAVVALWRGPCGPRPLPLSSC